MEKGSKERKTCSWVQRQSDPEAERFLEFKLNLVHARHSIIWWIKSRLFLKLKMQK